MKKQIKSSLKTLYLIDDMYIKKSITELEYNLMKDKIIYNMLNSMLNRNFWYSDLNIIQNYFDISFDIDSDKTIIVIDRYKCIYDVISIEINKSDLQLYLDDEYDNLKYEDFKIKLKEIKKDE